jgi:hypothetical protein
VTITTQLADIADIVHALGARRVGSQWLARCPAHDDSRPSLSIREGREGRVLVCCRAGCSQGEVISVLRARGLWPETRAARGPRMAASDPDWGADRECARYWALAARVWAEGELERLPLADGDRYPLTRMVLAIRRTEASDDLRVALYRWWRERDPQLSTALVHAGRLSDTRARRRLGQWIEGGMHGA